MPDDTNSGSLDRRSVLKSITAAGTLPIGLGKVAAQPECEAYDEANRVQESRLPDIVPRPVEVGPPTRPAGVGPSASSKTLEDNSEIIIDSDEARGVAEYLGNLLRPPTGYRFPIIRRRNAGNDTEGIALLLSGAPDEVGDEGYSLDVTSEEVEIRAHKPAGLFNGVQTLRQLLPAKVESDTEQSGPWTVSVRRITDYPRFSYRGSHLDVARHFFDVDVVKQYIDYLAQYKINHLHLHLTDDQGWRIEIDGWPNLTDEGADSEVGGGPGGYYTKEEYTEIVQYAQDRFITVIPEIDMPGHTGAALESYAELNCDGTKREEDTGTNVGDTALCVDKEITYEFIEDVISQVAEITPGPYIHLGGDEARTLSAEEYDCFMDRAVPMVIENGKRPTGWHQIFEADPPTQTIAQYWSPSRINPDVVAKTQEGQEIISSPASRAYLDMDYNDEDGTGQDWAGYTSVKYSYDWDPGRFLIGASESSVMGPEAALWTEYIETLDDIEYMTFPRLPAIAELGWTPQEKTTKQWCEFRHRLAAQGPRWDVQNINYYRSAMVPWP